MKFNFFAIYAVLKRLLVAIIFLTLGVIFITNFFGGDGKEEMALCKNLIENGAVADGAYIPGKSEERTTTIKGLEIKTYYLAYTFKAMGQSYNGTQILDALPRSSSIQVKYLPSDPTQNKVDPIIRLEKLKSEASGKFPLIAGLIFLLLGLGSASRSFKQIREAKANSIANKKVKKEPKETSKLLGNKEPATVKPINKIADKHSTLKSDSSMKETKSARASAVINKEELKLKSNTTFKETDHSRFMPPSRVSKSEEE